MLLFFFYTLNVLIFLAGLLHYREKTTEKQFSLALIQTLLSLPLLASEYVYFALQADPSSGRLIFFSEIVFILIWLSLTIRILHTTKATGEDYRYHFTLEFLAGTVLLIATAYVLTTHSIFDFFDFLESGITIPRYGFTYFSTLITLFIILFSSWKIEAFWRSINKSERWKFRFFIVGSLLICGALGWSCSYRLTYMIIYQKHLFLLSALIFSGWIMMLYDVMNYRLLNRKIFVSRKIVYTFVFPTLLAIYFICFGLISLVMSIFGLEMIFVMKWFLITLGVVGVILFGLSDKLRRRSHFFISTYFYTNKYEYRDEWLALSEHLQGAQSEIEAVHALRTVLSKSLYTDKIFIWLGDSEYKKDFTLVSWNKGFNNRGSDNDIRSDSSLVNYLENNSFFHIDEKERSPEWMTVQEQNITLIESLQLKLIAPIAIHNHLTGLIGLGAEYTGGKYSYDDFDLMRALGSQTASALMAIRMSEELATSREQQAWNRLSAFVLHDIKNAATMLSLLQENAPEHIHEPEFQDDMLELVDDTLKRMKRVEERLGTLKEDLTPDLQAIPLQPFLEKCSQQMMKKLPLMEIAVNSTDGLNIVSDPNLLQSIMENILLNASQAQNNKGQIQLKTNLDATSEHVTLAISDNGPGIDEGLLPDALFEPFKTTKDGGSGIGLWQVKKILTNMGGTISAGNISGGGACFIIRLPLVSSVG